MNDLGVYKLIIMLIRDFWLSKYLKGNQIRLGRFKNKEVAGGTNYSESLTRILTVRKCVQGLWDFFDAAGEI